MKDNKRDKRVLIPRDEFEEEAGEGLGRLDRDEAEADLLELRARMERRLRRPRAVWLPAAAAVVILLVASALLVTMLRDRPGAGSEMALAEEAVRDTAYIAMAAPLEKQDAEAPAPVAAESDAVQTRELRYSSLAVVIENEVAEMAMADEVIIAEEQKADDDVVYMVSSVLQEEQAEEVVVQAVPQNITTGMGIRSKAAERESVPAAGTRKEKAAAEAAKKEVTAAEASKKEAAAVPAAAKKEAEAVDVAAAGRQDAVTAPAAAAVTGAVMPDNSALPDGGWVRYRGWVAQNIRYPEDVMPVVRQEVIVSFRVRADSTLTGIKVIRSPGEPFTGEVYRLLREGPKWVPARISGGAADNEVILVFVFK